VKNRLCAFIDVWSNAEQKRLPRNRRSREQSFSFYFPGKRGGAREVLTRELGPVDQEALPTDTTSVHATTRFTYIESVHTNPDPTSNPTTESWDGKRNLAANI